MRRGFQIYLDTNVCEHHATKLETPIDSLSKSCDIDDFLSGDVGSRAAIFHVYFESDKWVDKLQQVYHHCDLIFVFCTELHSHTVEQLKMVDLPRVHIYVCGFINQYKFQHASVATYMDWFYTTSQFYLRSRPNFLKYRLDPFAIKPLVFDALLGEQREHRNVVYDYVNQNNLNNKIKMTYFGLIRPESEHGNILKKRGFEFDWQDPNLQYCVSTDQENIKWSVQYVKYHNERISMSQIVPLDVYQQTAYSLVAETNATNDWNFYTEKIVKPIMAQRLFIVVAGRHYLKNLRSFGFRTFGNIIDEGYDDIVDNQVRWHSAMDQVKYLCTLDQVKVFDQIRNTVEHNLNVLKNTDYHDSVFNEIDSLLTGCIPAD
jgi:hypothetical protein